MAGKILGSFQKKKSSSETTFGPNFAQDFFKQFTPAGEEALGQFDATGGPLREAAAAELLQNLSGSRLDPNTNPALGRSIGAIQRGGGEFLDSALSRIRSGAQGRGALLSTKAATTEAQAARDVSRDVSDRIANLVNQNTQLERDRTLSSIAPALGFGNQPLAQSLQIANFLRSLAQRGSGKQQAFGFQGGLGFGNAQV